MEPLFESSVNEVSALLDLSEKEREILGRPGLRRSGYSIMALVRKHFLDTRVARIYEGTDEIMELKIASPVL